MTKEEKTEIICFIDTLFHRINEAKEHIMNANYGLALKTLSEAYPQLTLKVDEESRS